MFGDKAMRETVPAGTISGLLEKGCEFEGKLTFEGTVRINGKFSGEILREKSPRYPFRLSLVNTLSNGRIPTGSGANGIP